MARWVFREIGPQYKSIVEKCVASCRLDFEEMQTVLFEVGAILNNRPLPCYYEDDVDECLTPNQLLFGRQLKHFNPDPFDISYTPPDLNVHSRKINNILNHFWDHWRKEYLINLRENHKVKLQKFNRPQKQLKDVVIVEEERQSRSVWRVGIVEELLQGKDSQIRGAKVKVPKVKSILKRPVNRLYLAERMKDTVTEVANEVINITDGRSRRETAILGEIKRKFNI